MVISVREALDQRKDNSNIDNIISQIDDFLTTPQADTGGLSFVNISAYERNQIIKLYDDAGWTVRWQDDLDLWTVFLLPKESEDY